MRGGAQSPVSSEDNFSGADETENGLLGEDEEESDALPNGNQTHEDVDQDLEEISRWEKTLLETRSTAFFKNAYCEGLKWSGGISLGVFAILWLWRAIDGSSSDRALDTLFSWGSDNKALEITLLTVFLFVGLCVFCTCYHGHHRSFGMHPKSTRALDVKFETVEVDDDESNGIPNHTV